MRKTIVIIKNIFTKHRGISHNNRKIKLLRFYKKIILLIWTVNYRYTLIVLLLNIVQGIIPIFTLYIGRLIIDTVVQGIAGGSGSFSKAIQLLLALLALNICSNFISSANNYTQTMLGDILSNYISIKVIEKAISLDLNHYENSTFYDMLSRAQREASFKPFHVLTQGFDLIKNIVSLISFIIVIYDLHWIIVIILMLVSIPNSFAQQKYARKGYSLQFSQTQDNRKMLYIYNILTSPYYFKEIKLYNIGNYFLNIYKKLFNRIYTSNIHLIYKKTIISFSFSILSVANYIAVYAFIIFKTINNAISLG